MEKGAWCIKLKGEGQLQWFVGVPGVGKRWAWPFKACLRSIEPTGVYWCILVYTGVYWGILGRAEKNGS